MFKLAKIVIFAATLVAVPATALAASTVSPLPGTWRKLPAAPVAFGQSEAGVWTGRQLILIGRTSTPAKDVAAAYDAASNEWTTLAPPSGPDYVPGYTAVWSGKEVLAFDPFHSVAYNPRTNHWRTLPKSINLGFVAWTGHEAIGWGGGCCGDAQADGSAYNPANGIYRRLPRSPLPPSQHAVGAWTGRELILLVSGYTPDGKAYPARYARAAAYVPATNSWRRLAALPERGGVLGNAVWDGRELLVVGAGAGARASYAYTPATNRWRRLASLPSARLAASALWTGTRLLLWGGQAGRYPSLADAHDGLAFDPRTNRWAKIRRAPLRASRSAVWTGRSLLVFGGVLGASKATHNEQVWLRDVAAFTPAAG